MNDPVDHRGGDGLIAEDPAPTAERQVARQDQRRVFVAAGNELEEQVRGVLLEREVADFVHDDQPVAAQPGELVGQPTLSVRVGESGDPVGCGREQHPVPVPGGDDPERGGEVSLPGSWRAEQDHVLRFEEEPGGGQRGDLLSGVGLRVPVEVLEGLAPGEAGGLDPKLGAGGVAGAHFAFQDGGEVVLE